MNGNPYEILGVSKDASLTDIKKAYRKLALQNHPDRQKTEEEKKAATAKFAKIAAAYEILSNEDERQKYDLSQGVQYYPTEMPQSPEKTTTTRVYRTTTSTTPRQTTSYSYSSPRSTRTVFQSSGSPKNFSKSFHFHDPKEVFRQVFVDDIDNVDLEDKTTGSPKKNSQPVSMSSSTRTVTHADGRTAVITETTIVHADGSTEKRTSKAVGQTSKISRLPKSSFRTRINST